MPSETARLVATYRERILNEMKRRDSKREREEKFEEELDHERRLAQVRANPMAEATGGPAIAPVVWTGTRRQLAALISELRTLGLIKTSPSVWADSDAVCAHFIDEKGETMDGQSVWQNLKNVTEDQKPMPLKIILR
jgi:hypothetical protein